MTKQSLVYKPGIKVSRDNTAPVREVACAPHDTNVVNVKLLHFWCIFLLFKAFYKIFFFYIYIYQQKVLFFGGEQIFL